MDVLMVVVLHMVSKTNEQIFNSCFTVMETTTAGISQTNLLIVLTVANIIVRTTNFNVGTANALRE